MKSKMQQHIDSLTKRIHFRILDSSIFPSTAKYLQAKEIRVFFFHNVFLEKVDGQFIFLTSYNIILLFLKRPIFVKSVIYNDIILDAENQPTIECSRSLHTIYAHVSNNIVLIRRKNNNRCLGMLERRNVFFPVSI